MAMSLGDAGGGEEEVIAAINTTPLVDVMLVLLIIFLITVPVVTHTVPIKLPNEINRLYEPKVENINLAVRSDGHLYWNDESIAGQAVLLERLKKVAAMKPQPGINIRGDQNARYEFVGRTILTAQRAGIVKIGFILEPPARS
ncbi:ExbD/TolR family protein [Herbaspirillum chlorophenolicum]|uniref:ExbD/TolR family protein n=1 Tax=Herbaspirillum chlorophenolicum TaxID=211589 RepID=UPI000B06DB52|nr:biopolymer transporter ExbD [Herbaspirillum chlorophenolicum]